MADKEELTPKEKEEARKKKERDALALLFLLLLSDTNDRLTTAVQSYISGSVSSFAMSDSMTSTLVDAHSHAAYLGRRLAGVRLPFGAADVQFGQSVALDQSKYLAGLVNDLRQGRYKPGPDEPTEEMPGDLTNRLRLYTKRLRGTSEEAWLNTLAPGTLIYWRLGNPKTEHCEICPELAAGGPYKADRMPTTPGLGDTPCFSACLCYLVADDGASCFHLPPTEDWI